MKTPRNFRLPIDSRASRHVSPVGLHVPCSLSEPRPGLRIADCRLRFLIALEAVILLVGPVLVLTSCSALDRYERTYSATYDADAQSGAVSITLKPYTPPAVPVSDEAINRAVKKAMEELAKYKPPTIEPVDLTKPVEVIP